MRRIVSFLIAGALVLVLSACHPPMHHKGMSKEGQSRCCRMSADQQSTLTRSAGCCKMAGQQAAVAADVRADVLYACDCGPGCTCNTLSKQPGKCACGKPLRWHHVLKVENDQALLCSCAEGCKCALDPADSSRCGCGKPVKRVSLKGSGLFFCDCGGSCTCNTVSSEAGECRCGMPLKQMN